MKLIDDKYFLFMATMQIVLTAGILYLLCVAEESVSQVEQNVNVENAKYLGGLWMFIAGGMIRDWLGSES